ncbi:cytochrome b-c1 complex subunit 7 [Patella vulgata]|uniref:cytochrome b-c1 complex subunit 7 n=1 Tax=Patella vulgata TaxID=6465 RepID=UPI002180728A|nr:cytochrome b-c1 complex subunit 7 [Patella vulgata]
MAAPIRRAVAEMPAWRKALQRWAYHKSNFGKLGLMIDDCLYETPEVKEAVSRLPADLYNQRVYRISRALNLSMRKDILPKEEQHTVDDDVRYLKPYLDEVKKEKAEKLEWDLK